MPENLKIQGKMNFHLICLTHSIVDGVADKVLIPTKEGDVMVLKDRAPLFLFVEPGALWVYNKGEKPACYLVSRGIAEIRRNICSVLAWGVPINDVDPARAQKDLRAAEEELENIHSKLGRQQVLYKIEYLKFLLNGPLHIIEPDFK